MNEYRDECKYHVTACDWTDHHVGDARFWHGVYFLTFTARVCVLNSRVPRVAKACEEVSCQFLHMKC